jgi:hypothetical protein
MAILKDKVKLELLVNGNGPADNFKNNSLFFYDKYSKSDKDVMNIPVGKMQIGGFYFLQYEDDSNWMKWSPIFTIDFKKFSNMIVIFGVNFNFIPLEFRVGIFDKYINDLDFEKDNLLKVSYKGVYEELRKYGFEYAINEYNMSQIKYVHKISMNMVPRFLYSQFPKNKYDPNGLMKIWTAKIDKRDQRHKEMTSAIISDFYKMDNEISEKYVVLNDHINRLQKSIQKYGSH